MAIYNVYLKSKGYCLVNVNEYLPEDEILTLRQLFFLLMRAGCFTFVVLAIVFNNIDLSYLQSMTLQFH